MKLSKEIMFLLIPFFITIFLNSISSYLVLEDNLEIKRNKQIEQLHDSSIENEIQIRFYQDINKVGEIENTKYYINSYLNLKKGIQLSIGDINIIKKELTQSYKNIGIISGYENIGNTKNIDLQIKAFVDFNKSKINLLEQALQNNLADELWNNYIENYFKYYTNSTTITNSILQKTGQDSQLTLIEYKSHQYKSWILLLNFLIILISFGIITSLVFYGLKNKIFRK